MAIALVTAERVRSALATLPDDQRRAIQLAYFGGKTYRQVAEVLGIPEGTAKSRLRLGLRRIAGVLETETVGRSEWPMSTDDTMLDELLGAYALDAVDADEAVAVEEYLARVPHAAHEVARLRNAAAWIGATEALTPPPELHDTVLAEARARRPTTSGRSAPDDAFLAVYLSVTSRFDAVLDEVTDELLDVRTFNGLAVRELVIHLASMESTVAQVIGRPTVPDVTELDIERRTADFHRTVP